MSFFKIVLLFLCCNLVWTANTYKAAIVDVSNTDINSSKYASLIREAGETDVDLLVLPTPRNVVSETEFNCINGVDNYDEIIKSLSIAAKDARVYVLAQLIERYSCQNREELIRSNVVFDRNGAVISVYRKPVNSRSKCNTTVSKMAHFTTDFGVTFGVLMEDDIILTNVKHINGIKNFIVSTSSETAFLFAKQFSTFWAYTNNINVITDNGKFSGNINTMKTPNNLIVSEFENYGASDISKTLTVTPPTTYFIGDMSQYIIKPLNLEASSQGHTETVCQGSLCCQFYVKTSLIGSNYQDVTYGLVVLDGVQNLGNTNIGLQTCSVLACAGLYKRSCFVGSEKNSTNIVFDNVLIKGNFSNGNTAHYPTILTTAQSVMNKENFRFTPLNKNSKYVTAELYNTGNVLSFGIFGRDYSKDYETSEFGSVNNTSVINDLSDYILSDNVQEFFDYLWIRLRVLIFVVSIYVLEMM
ncbi:vanin-like protein 3 [Nymphalis io]|uniref:vanin-like protein 3 n=1 Tax=Inachis io TaxID=171585 RepID=UPI0021693C06|nr:vanin-like protein 3 [Nymphalis io]